MASIDEGHSDMKSQLQKREDLEFFNLIEKTFVPLFESLTNFSPYSVRWEIESGS